jgi:dethiobiotin synthetase
MEKVAIDIEQILSAFRTLQERVEYVVVEGTGGWYRFAQIIFAAIWPRQ